ncbi:phosphate metabolism protein 7 [Coemansia sp. BCRC 34962]|nr:phosphate metabolism protein 7 [Coemansia sp. BCRC 34962]
MGCPFTLSSVVSLSFEGQPTKWHKELTLMNYVMCFEVVDAFIIPVAASTVFSSLDTFIRNPVAAAAKIVAEIPTVSTFFMAYVLMRALTNSAMDIARVIHILHHSLVKTQVPVHALVFLLGAMYSPMAPLMAVTATAYYALFSFVYAYKFMNVYDDTSFRLGGRIAVKLLQQRWISLYVSQAVFCGAFAIRTSTRKTTQARLQLVLACTTLAGTFVAHMVAKHQIYPDLLYPKVSSTSIDEGAQESQDDCANFATKPTEATDIRLCFDSARDSPSIQEMSHYMPLFKSLEELSFKNHAGNAPPIEKENTEKMLRNAAPLVYEPWRVDPRPEAAQVGPGARLRRDLSTNTHLLWQDEMTDPGYVFIWLPDIQAEEDAKLSADMHPTNQECAMLSGGILERRASSKKTAVVEEGTKEFSCADIQTIADMLYAEIDHRLGSFGCVVTMHAVLDKSGIRATTPTQPENPVHPMMRRA